MDPAKQSSDSNSIGEELAHITQEMYKKNAELSYTNKALTILRKLDQIILSTVTDVSQIAQQAVNLIIGEQEYKIAILYVYDPQKNILTHVATSKNDVVEVLCASYPHVFEGGVASLAVLKAITSKEVQLSNEILDIFPNIKSEEKEKFLKALGALSFAIYPLVVRGEVIGVMTLAIVIEFSDLTSYDKELSQRITDVIGIAVDNALLYKRIEEANVRLKALDRAKDEFVSLASHELRTPMTIIKSYLWLLLQQKKGPINEKQKQDLERAFFSTERLINLVNDMLNISRIESGRLTVNKIAMNLAEVIDSTVSEINPKALEQNVKLSYQKNSTVLLSVFADPERIKQILINLIGNSLKFTGSGGSITITTDVEGDMLKVTVSDTGKGIKKEDIPKLFQKFNIVGNDYLTKQTTQSTGLGLYLSKSLVELHGGKIWVESDGEGKGAKFCFTLPFAHEEVKKPLT